MLLGEKMLNKIYIDNYKTLVNCEINIDRINLFIGDNGAGKSTVFEVINAIQHFVCDKATIEISFNADNKTRWQTLNCQTFEMEMKHDEGTYQYQLSIEHHEEKPIARVKYERLLFENNPLLKMENGDVHLYRDNFSQGPSYPADWTLSALGAIPSRSDNTKLTWFKNRLKGIVLVQPIPTMMMEESPKEEEKPSKYLENYTSWYRFLSQDQGLAFQLMSDLKQILPGFDYFKFESVGEKHRLLKVYFKHDANNTSIGYKFNELSDGQRMLIALYTLLSAARSEQLGQYTLCIDEPENFLALPEIQPWLTALFDRCSQGEMQCLLISHHPEFINYLLSSPIGYLFERQSHQPTRIKHIGSFEEKEGIPMSEIIARGWVDA